jgi:hypothetical protein
VMGLLPVLVVTAAVVALRVRLPCLWPFVTTERPIWRFGDVGRRWLTS